MEHTAEKIKYSRIGSAPIDIPAGVTVTVDDKLVKVKGPLGELSQIINSNTVKAKVENGRLLFVCESPIKSEKAKHGLYKSLAKNMVTGVTQGFTKKLIVGGVSVKCSVQGKKLVMDIGYSHLIELEPPVGVTITCPLATEIEVKGISKELVGQTAAKIKAYKPVEPYHGYGIRYSDEVVLRKEIKKAGK
ncbi:MAG: 50S ribosomal protein L6 [Firmicutes bacterium]|nr:50S ribosomal protein L6 [Bacillota bacterium]